MSEPKLEIYYHTFQDSRLEDAFQQNYVLVGTNTRDIKASMFLAEADLYSEEGVFSGKFTSCLNICEYPIEKVPPNFSLLRQRTFNLFLLEGNISGMVIQNNLDKLGNITFTPVYQSGIYYGKNILVNSFLINSNTIKITVFIFN
jgi:hypothetical protein